MEGIPTISNQPATPLSPGLPLGLRIHTDLPALPLQEEEDTDPPSSPPPPLPGQRLTPSRLRLNQFGSRFLPHTEHAIRCVLPLLDDSLLLIGHDRGLSVLDMFPQQWTEHGSVESLGPDDAQARIMWEGEAYVLLTPFASRRTHISMTASTRCPCSKFKAQKMLLLKVLF